MFRFMVFLLLVLGLALLFSWVADNPGMVFFQWEWLAARLGRPGEEVGLPLTVVIVAVIAFVAIAMLISGFLRGLFGMPGFVSRFFDNRRRERGYRALSRGLIAASSGDVDSARSLTKESRRLLPNDPLVSLLGTQTALLEGNRDAARENFKAMLEDPETRMVALRGLFLEAERQGEGEAARHYAEEAAREAPALSWASTAKLRYQAADGDWDSAIQTLEANRAAGLIDRAAAKRYRAVLLTAKALSVEQAEPETARKLAKEAHKLAKELVPAATTYARTASRLGDIRSATRVIEACWKLEPHPELADAYANVRTGDSAKDRLKRARKLAALKENHPEGNMAVAVAAMDAREWDMAREALGAVLKTRPTERACLLMAEIEEGQHGDKGMMRNWLARAVRAPADMAWTADGHVSPEWLPLSPVTGEIDAFEWKVPFAQLGSESGDPVLTVDQAGAEMDAGDAEKPEIPDNADIEDAVVLEGTGDQEAVDADDKIDAEKPPTDSAKAEKALGDNVIPLDGSEPKDDMKDARKEDVGDEAFAKNPSPYSNTVKFPLERRPDDPGPHPDKEPPKKGFKLF